VIPRYQSVLFFLLLAASIIMGAILWQLLNHAHQRRLKGEQSTPTQAPLVAPAEQATLMVADDSDDSMSTRVLSLPLPPDPGARARAILGKLLDLYAAPDAAHPVPGGASSIAQIFLLPVALGSSTSAGSDDSGAGIAIAAEPGPDSSAAAASASPRTDSKAGPELAVVNLTDAFAASHPSGIETESLTVLSICATLHANLPRITEVRFLVDGHQHETLAGHADLTRTYLTTEAAPAAGAQP
jgi:Sporulation and spore germination